MAKRDWHILAKEQRLGALLLFLIALAVWLTVAVCSSDKSVHDTSSSPKKYRSWEERKDSMRHADSLRYAQWAMEREQRYDSFRLADAQRREEWKRERQHLYDSLRTADSLWRDSVGWRFAKRIKKDTVLDLNHTDTAELQWIRGIGAYTAIRIMAYREQLGGYYSPSQLTDEPLSALHLDTLLSHFTADVKDIQTIPVNRASVEWLQRHPYLRFRQAKAIYALRRKNVRLSSMDAIRELPEMSEADCERIAPYLSFE